MIGERSQAIFSPLVSQLIEALRVLPGVGVKTAQRMAFHLLEHKTGGEHLAQILKKSLEQIKTCAQCRIFSEKTLCQICSSPYRDHSLLCVVQGPAHVAAIEQTGYHGVYFVLAGHLSPIDGRGPEEVGIDLLAVQLSLGSIKEVVLATNSTVEGEATAHYIAMVAKKVGLRVSRLAHGIPMGGDLEYLDGGTLTKALADRTLL